MIRTIIGVFVVAIMFVAGFGVSFFLVQKEQAKLAEETAREASQTLDEKVPGNVTAEAVEPAPSELPVPVHPNQLSAEELFRYGASIQGQHEALLAKYEELSRYEERLKLMQQDIRGSRQELDGVQAKVENSLSMAERLLAQLQAEWAELESQSQAKPDKQNDEQAPDSASNEYDAKKISQVVSGMPTEAAAEYLKQLTNTGRIHTAAQILDNIESRDVAKILSALDDPALWVQLTESLGTAKRPNQDPNRR